MKNTTIHTKNNSSSEQADHELEQIISDLVAHLRKSGTICGKGSEINELRRKRSSR